MQDPDIFLARPQALRASCGCTAPPLLVAGALVCGICRAPIGLAIAAAGAPFSQRELPPGTGRAKFLRVARALRAAGDPGAWREGRSVLVTPDAWARGLTTLGQGRRAAPRAPASFPNATLAASPSTPDELALAALGLRRRAS